jgi:hypothetical protein
MTATPASGIDPLPTMYRLGLVSCFDFNSDKSFYYVHMPPFPRPIGRRILYSCIQNELDLILISHGTGCLRRHLQAPAMCTDFGGFGGPVNTHIVLVAAAISWKHPPHTSLYGRSLVHSIGLLDTDVQHEHRLGPRYLQHHVRGRPHAMLAVAQSRRDSKRLRLTLFDLVSESDPESSSGTF